MNPLGGVRYGAEIFAAARAHGLDPALLAAVAAQETGGPGATSGRNVVGDGGHGRGVFQIDDRSWAFARTPAAMDPGRNAAMAAQILADDLRAYHGDVHAALSAYNTGRPDATGTRTTWADGRTLGYADSVLRHEAALAGAPGRQPLWDARSSAPAGAGATAFVAPVTEAALLSAPAAPPPSLTESATTAPGAGGFTPLRSWAMLARVAGDAGSVADAGRGDLLEAGDVFDDVSRG